jgi:aspartate-semialdehyde dehydrogenase
MPPHNGYNVAVLGATGIVGRTAIAMLLNESPKLPIKSLHAIASQRSKGIQLFTGQKSLYAKTFEDLDLSEIDIVFNALKGDVTKTLMPELLKSSAFIIDKSSVYRNDTLTPLVVSGVNDDMITLKNQQLIATPNCCVIPLVHVLFPLMNIYSIHKITLSTYQSVSGAGFAAMAALENGEDTPLAFNVIPNIGETNKQTGATDEEEKIVNETNKILNIDLPIAVTCVRVPVMVGHCICANIEFKSDISLKRIFLELEKFGCIISDKGITPKEVAGKDYVYVSRIRKNLGDGSLSLWITSDNLRRGAATNAIEIAYKLASLNLL